MSRAIENNIYSAMKMRKGHRRTQSDIVHITQNYSQATQQPKPDMSHLQIAELLKICNQKVKQKVSNIEVLSQPSQNSYLCFKFGQNSYKRSIKLTQNDDNGIHLACIPEKKQPLHQDYETITSFFPKRAQLRVKKGDHIFEEKSRRLPFLDALNNRARQRRKAQPEKIRQERTQIRNKLVLKLKF